MVGEVLLNWLIFKDLCHTYRAYSVQEAAKAAKKQTMTLTLQLWAESGTLFIMPHLFA